MFRLATAAVVLLALAGCTSPGSAPSSMDLASASPEEVCKAQGGKPTLERGADGDIGICQFPENRQCELRALQFGECPRGGIPITGYATSSERHCAIRGGHMTIPGCALSPAGLYETRSLLLVLQAGRAAVLRTEGAEGTTLLPGTWQGVGKLVTVSLERERLVFDYAGDRLAAREWDRRYWGADGPGTLLRRK